MQSGQLKIPPGYHPLDVEKEWGRLHVAILEREKLLRSEFERQAGAPRGKLGGAGAGVGHFLFLGKQPGRQEGRSSLPTAAGPAQP